MRRAVFVVLIGLVMGGAAEGRTVGEKYQALKVERFGIENGAKLPPEYFATLHDELVKQLTESQRFTAVLAPDKDAPAEVATLCLDGVVTGFDPGSRAKRYFGIGSAGAARIFAHVRYHDCASGQLVIEEEMIGTMASGVFGGDTKNVAKEFAKTVVTTTRMVLLKNLPAPGSAAAPKPATDSKDQKVVAITADDVLAGEQQLNALGAAGYRLVHFTPTGGSGGNLTLEKLTDPGLKYEYRVLRTMLISHLEKDLNKQARDGYRMVPHSICSLRNFAIIAERPVGTTSGVYEYRLESAMMLSNAEKNVREFQRKGFELVDAANLFGPFIVVMEKSNAPKVTEGTL